ncbi:hypothetical protein [Sphingomonas sp. NFR15]|uniref:hypothetical protein n=1 Tax=Sphingomonas sp. NFR15 TaxID=1566282 RepID=UPI00089028A2|nr:hypothetical protein [Sphingomonas sp. NFR15]SDA22552.1 hypothetical protein SAMN03159340_01600 [Sphingomonas sp. NFR15]
MSDDRANTNEGADPSNDIHKQNPGGTTTNDLTRGQQDGSDAADEAEEMEEVQKEAAEEREENGGYQ